MLVPEIVGKTLNAPWHLAKGVAHLVAGAPIRAITGTKDLTGTSCYDNDTDGKGPATVYEIANPMMDITSVIYFYTELRSATNKRLKDFAEKKGLTYELNDTDTTSDLEVIRNALKSMNNTLEAIKSADKSSSTTAALTNYQSSLKEIKDLKTRYSLGDGDMQVLEIYFSILAEPKDLVQIKSDIELYTKYISPQFILAFGGKGFNLQSVVDMVDRDPDMFIHHIDDDFAFTSMDAAGFVNGLNSEVVYAIVVSEKNKRITVVFRGSVNAKDWMTNVQMSMTDFELPGFTTEEARTQLRQMFGRVHGGFHEYLFGKTMRGMNGSTKSKAEEIMGTLTGLMEEYKGFSIFVTGHSLGGALSTLFAFRAAAFGELPMITNVSFASPYCGDQGFRDHFYELEKSKRIRHLRVSNDEDIVTLLPNITLPIPNEFYKHTGMNIRLYNDEDQFLMPKCRLFYPKKGSLLNEVRNAVLSNFVAGLSVGVLSKHLCPEYSKRLDDAEEELQKITLEGLYSDPDITGWSYRDFELSPDLAIEDIMKPVEEVNPIEKTKASDDHTKTNLDAHWVKAPEVLGQVHCITIMKDGTILGIGMNHKLYTRTNLGASWVMAPDLGQVKGVTIMTDGTILGIGMSGKLYTRANLNSRWVKAPDFGKVKVITIMKDGTILGVGMNDKFYTRDDLTVNWAKAPDVGGQVKGVAIMGDGTILGVGMNGKLSTRANLNVKWVMAPDVGQRKVKAITIMEDGTILGVGINNKLYIRSLETALEERKTNTNLDAYWVKAPEVLGQVHCITMMNDGTILGIGMNHKLYTRTNLDDNWVMAPDYGQVKGVTIMTDGIILGIGMSGKLYTRANLNSRWVKAFDHGKVKAITVMKDGTILGVDMNGKIHTRANLGTKWVKTPEVGGQVKGVAIMGDGTILGVGMNGKLYMRANLGAGWVMAPDVGQRQVKAITIMEDGTILGVGINNKLFIRSLDVVRAVSVPPKKLVFLSEEEFALPATISFDATMGGNADLILPWFSSNKKPWGDKDCDALTWFLAANRDDFTFRFRGYHFDHKAKQLSKLRSIPGKSNRIVCTITSTSAEYYIDGTEYATVEYPLGTLGSTGHFGIHTAWNQQALRVSNLEIDGAVSVPPKKLVFLSEEEFALPATISFDATMYGDGDPVIPWFSSNKKPWGDKDCDALTWFLAANRDDFTFRFRGYQGDGHNVTQLSKLRSIPGKSNRIVCTITSTSAEYYIDGTEYATVEYPLGTLGPTGHFGIHTAWNQQALRVSNLEIDGE